MSFAKNYKEVSGLLIAKDFTTASAGLAVLGLVMNLNFLFVTGLCVFGALLFVQAAQYGKIKKIIKKEEKNEIGNI